LSIARLNCKKGSGGGHGPGSSRGRRICAFGHGENFICFFENLMIEIFLNIVAQCAIWKQLINIFTLGFQAGSVEVAEEVTQATLFEV
jgi:hypothetical protein